MDVYIARQPIFDRSMRIYGYELLYRQSSRNAFVEMDDDQATTELICNSLLVVGLSDLTDGTKAFINFSKALIDSDVPTILPKESVVLEILERGKATQATVAACDRMRARGYQLALDDVVMDESFLPLMDKADIIKVEYPSVSYNDQRRLIRKYRGKPVRFLAEKIETREDYRRAVDIGYDYFQGFFFSKPAMINSREIVSLNANMVAILEELNRPEPSYEVIADIISGDLGLTYKLLKLANSVYLGTKYKIDSIPQALSYIGLKEIRQWISLMMLKNLQNVENAEMIKLSMIRGKLMELLARALQNTENASDYFFTGMFSFIDQLISRPMPKILEGLPLSRDVKQALTGEPNEYRRLLDFVVNCEYANWNKIEKQYPLDIIGIGRFMDLYMESLRWARQLNY